MKVILHVDINSFFASCHMAEDKTLENKPVVVAPNKLRSIIVTANYVARKYNIKAGDPLFLAKEKCDSLVVIKSDFSLYVKYAEKFFNLLKKYTNLIEIASIDECFMDVTTTLKNYNSVKELCAIIQKDVLTELQLPVSIGASFNKTFAKIASDLKKPLGITIINEHNYQQVIWPLSIHSVSGLGKKSCNKLNTLEIFTINDLVQYELTSNESLTVFNLITKFKAKLTGNDLKDTIISSDNSIKSIGNEETFEKDFILYEDINNFFKKISNHISLRLKNRVVVGNVIYFTIKYADQNTKKITRQIKLKDYTSDANVIYKNAINLFEKYWNNKAIRLLGVGVSNLLNKFEQKEQISLNEIMSNNKIKNITTKISKITNSKVITGDRFLEEKYINDQQNKYIEADKVKVKKGR